MTAPRGPALANRHDCTSPTRRPGIHVRVGLLYCAVAPALFLMSAAVTGSTERLSTEMLEEVRITATLQPSDTDRASVSLIGPETMTRRSARHLEDILSAAPNVNAASGASRARFFQVRGIGERSQFVEPVNASVAMMLDGIDLTGIGGVATLWDVQQVSILRGPQGTLLGANALAGLIDISSVAPDSDGSSVVEVGIENYSGRRIGAAVGTRLANSDAGEWSGRIAAQSYQSDGYINNTWLGRNDTSARDELTVKGSLAWENANHRVDLGVYHIAADNGYDAFSLDNTRETLSDQPGQDSATTDAARIRWQREGAVRSILQLSVANTDTRYSYDEDWAYGGIAPDLEYSSFDQYDRDREMASLEARLEDQNGNTAWVLGTYLRQESESLERRYTYLPGPFTSGLKIDTEALFGQVDQQLTDRIGVFIGARIERRESRYSDNNDIAVTLADTLWSGKLGLQWQASAQSLVYATLSRGVRGGGVNAGLLATLQSLPPGESSGLEQLGFFEDESLYSAELGWRWQSADSAVSSDLTLFTMSRRDQQVRQSLTRPRPDGSTLFLDFTDNAARGSNDGVEWQLSWQLTDDVAVQSNLGLLDATFNDYVTAENIDLSGREQPQAPRFMGNLALLWQPLEPLSVGLELTAMDDYLFSDRHETRSPARQLLNASATWTRGAWSVQLWGRNLADEDYFERGFGSFGNDPRKEYAVEPYFQFAEPRVLGLTLAFKP